MESPSEDSDDDDAVSEETVRVSADVREKLVEVLRLSGDVGILGSQLPEAFRKYYGDKLLLETKRGRRVKLINILDGHPNARKDTRGMLKWFYVPSLLSPAIAANSGGQTFAAADSSKIPMRGKGSIERDVLAPDAFPTLAWLADHNMNMFKWTGNSSEWTHFALRLRPDVAAIIEGDADGVASLRRRSGCEVKLGREILHGNVEKFLVFTRGEQGAASNGAIVVALDLINNLLKELLPTLDSHAAVSTKTSPGGAIDDRVHKNIEIPAASIGLILGKSNKRLQLMRRKSGAYMNLVTKGNKSSKGSAKLTLSGTPENVEMAVQLVRAALASKADE
jgi:hypothetical protein